MPKIEVWGCTITGTNFHRQYDKTTFKYFNFIRKNKKYKIEAFGLYASLGMLTINDTVKVELEQKFVGQLNLYNEQLQKELNGNKVELITILPEKSVMGDLVALKITFEFISGLTAKTFTLNPSPPAPPSQSIESYLKGRKTKK